MRPFALERYFALHEFKTQHLLSASDCETMTVGEVLSLASVPVTRLHDIRLGYTESQGDPVLREKIASLYDGVSPDQVLTTAAPQEGILLVMSALLAPGDRIIALTPCYQSLTELARWRGCRVDPWPLVEAPEGWDLDMDRLEDLLAAPARLLVINFPHNPTGMLPSRQAFEAVLESARRHRVQVFSDEMYRGLEPSSAIRLPAAVERDGGAVSLWGLSKSFGLPGLRVGWLVTHDQETMRRLQEMKDYTTICSSGPGELLAAAALDCEAALLERARQRIAANLGEMGPFMQRWSRVFAWHPPQAGPVALTGLRGQAATAFCEQVRQAAGVLLVPSMLFGCGDRHVRFGLGRARLADGLAALDQFLERLEPA